MPEDQIEWPLRVVFRQAGAQLVDGGIAENQQDNSADHLSPMLRNQKPELPGVEKIPHVAKHVPCPNRTRKMAKRYRQYPMKGGQIVGIVGGANHHAFTCRLSN